MRKVEHVGTVVHVDGGKALIQLKPSDQCGNIGFRCACCASVQPEARKVRVERGDLEEGDVVCVSIPAPSGYMSALILFVLPMALFVLGAVIGWIAKGKAPGDDMPVIIGGICGFALAVLVAVIVNRRASNAQNLEVRRVRQGGP